MTYAGGRRRREWELELVLGAELPDVKPVLRDAESDTARDGALRVEEPRMGEAVTTLMGAVALSER